MSTAPGTRIALLPLDDRPVNVLLPQDVARVAGVVVDTPPPEILPVYRTPGDTAALGSWLLGKAEDPATRHLIVSLDMLCHGGLIASRISQDTTLEVLDRLNLLRRIRAMRSDLKISAVSLVMRASDSYSAVEEPEYWAEYGQELHRLGGDIHRLDGNSDVTPPSIVGTIPPQVVSDFAMRRVRNHIINLSALGLVEDGTLDFLAITADDTAHFSAGSAEQEWLRHWMRFLPKANRVLMYPGADEVGATLVARAISEDSGESTSIRVVCPEPSGLDLVPPFENTRLAESISRQITAADAQEVDDDADVVLVIHAPDPQRHDLFGGPPPIPDLDAVERTVTAVREAVAGGGAVALADVRFSNGSDPALVWRLEETGLLETLTSFGGWNTAGNTLGSVIALAVAATIGTKTGRLDSQALQQALVTRILDDFAYQSVIRPEISPQLFSDQFPVVDDNQLARAESAIGERMKHMLETELPFYGWTLSRLNLPWRRSFEVSIGLHCESGRKNKGQGQRSSSA